MITDDTKLQKVFHLGAFRLVQFYNGTHRGHELWATPGAGKNLWAMPGGGYKSTDELEKIGKANGWATHIATEIFSIKRNTHKVPQL